MIILLKILGYTLLAAVGLLLLSLCLLLFVPVRYTAYVSGESLDIGVNIKASWFLKLVRLRYTHSKDTDDLQIRVLWFKIRLDEPEEPPAAPKSDESTRSKAVDEAVPPAHLERAPENTRPEQKFGAEDIPHTRPEPEPAPAPSERGSDGGKRVRHERRQRSGGRVRGIFEQIKDILSKISYYKNYPGRDEIISATWKLLKQLWRAAKPKKFRLDGDVGFESPHHTGYLFAVLGILNLCPDGLRPSFDEKLLCLNAEVRGHLNLWSILWPLFRYAIKRPIWPITKKLLLER